MQLTDAKIESIKPREARYVQACGGGLYLRVYSTGRKTWAFRCTRSGQQENVTLGVWPRTSLSVARKAAVRMRALASEGGSPRSETWARRMKSTAVANATVEEFAARWMIEIVAKDRKDTKPVDRYLRRDILPKIGKLTVAKVQAENVQAIVFARRDAGRPAAAGAIRDVLHRLFEYARVCGLVTTNPAAATPARFVYAGKSRRRHLSAAELKAFYRGIAVLTSRPSGVRYAIALEILLLTLARKSELRLARWQDLQLDQGLWEIPEENSKTGVPHLITLPPRARALFAKLRDISACVDPESYILPAQNSLTQPMAANALNKAMQWVQWGISNFTPHDLRRTAATHLAEQGYEDNWIEAALNHSKKGIRGVYNRARYGEQRAKMLQEWSDWLEQFRKNA